MQNLGRAASSEFFAVKPGFCSPARDHRGKPYWRGAWDIDAKRIAQMDKAGVDMQILSFTTPGRQGFVAKEAIPIAQDANERLYAPVQRHPSRFAGLAALPTAESKVAADELERTVKDFGFKGAMIHGHQQGADWPRIAAAFHFTVPSAMRATRRPEVNEPGTVRGQPRPL